MAIDAIHPKERDCLTWSRATHYGAAITAQVVLLAYFELCILIPLGRWNDQPGISVPFSSGNIILGAAIGGVQLLLLIGTVRRLKPLLWFGLLGDTVWLLLHIYSLWLPYILGASPQYQAAAKLRESPCAGRDAHLY